MTCDANLLQKSPHFFSTPISTRPSFEACLYDAQTSHELDAFCLIKINDDTKSLAALQIRDLPLSVCVVAVNALLFLIYFPVAAVFSMSFAYSDVFFH